MDSSKQRQSQKRESGAKGPGQRRVSKETAALPDIKRALASPMGVLSLQRAIGNRAVNRLVEGQPPTNTAIAPPAMGPAFKARAQSRAGRASNLSQPAYASAPGPSGSQATMRIGPADDAYEKQADRMASHVVRAIRGQTAPHSPLYRAPITGMGALRLKPASPSAAGMSGGLLDSGTQTEIQGARGSGQPLSSALRGPMEQAFGADFSAVSIHTDARSDRVSRSLRARAFTTGSDVFFRQGAYAPDSSAGQELIAHELAHTVQQGGGSAQSLHRQPIQRYFEAAPNEYLPQVAPVVAPMFESNATDPTSDPTTATVRYAKQNDAKPPLKVADDFSLAINATDNEPKEFYATDPVVASANNALAEQSSPVTLDNSIGHQIDMYGANLKMVRPTRNGTAINLQANEFADFLEHKCINVALEVMGKVNWANFRSMAVLKDRTDPLQPETRVPLNPGGTVIPETEKLANLMGSRPNQAVSRTDASTAMTDDQDVGSVGRAYGLQQGRGDLDQAEQSLGVNKYAKAGVGQGYMTETLASTPTETKKDYSEMTPGKLWGENPAKRESVWGYHFAAVAAQSLDGADQITLENYNRTVEMNEKLAGLERQMEQRYRNQHGRAALALLKQQMTADTGSAKDRIGMIQATLIKGAKATALESQDAIRNVLENAGKMWYFRMVGSKSGQSFHELMAQSGYFANPMTMVVEAPIEASRTDGFFALDSAALAGVELNGFKGPAPSMIADLRRRPARRMTITGYMTADESGRDDTLSQQRAQNAKQLLVNNGVPAGQIDAVEGGIVGDLTGGRNDLDPNQRVVAVIAD